MDVYTCINIYKHIDIFYVCIILYMLFIQRDREGEREREREGERGRGREGERGGGREGGREGAKI